MPRVKRLCWKDKSRHKYWAPSSGTAENLSGIDCSGVAHAVFAAFAKAWGVVVKSMADLSLMMPASMALQMSLHFGSTNGKSTPPAFLF